MSGRLCIFLISLCCLPLISVAQNEVPSHSKNDSMKLAVAPAADDSLKLALLVDSLNKDTLKMGKNVTAKIFKPDPNRAVLYALVPGLGQIYNKKYWKLPIVYGGLMGCMYAVSWNNRNYSDYKTAYFDIMKDAKNVDNPSSWSTSWQDLIPAGADPANYVSNSTFQTNLKRRKDYYRRYRDLSIIISVGVYAISIIDAYVDAQLFDFDISPDLSFHWSPAVMPKTSLTAQSYGLNCALNF